MIDRGNLRTYCLAKGGAFEDFPFGEEVAIYKVMGKIFALIPLDTDPPTISLKCDPILAGMLRETYPSVTPGWHLNKKHWNSVKIDGTVADDEIEEWIDHSYEQVVKGLTKAQKAALHQQS
jgi:predicted DNA-binding protein (MmcQ/YjbR family)